MSTFWMRSGAEMAPRTLSMRFFSSCMSACLWSWGQSGLFIVSGVSDYLSCMYLVLLWLCSFAFSMKPFELERKELREIEREIMKEKRQ
jgi:hypothetical protein